MAIDTTKKIKQVTYNGTEIPLSGTDTSDATVTASDLAKGVVAYGKNGRVVGDIVKSALPSNQMSLANTSIETSDGQIWFKGNFDEGTVIASKSRIGTYIDFLGDATAADVAKGKTFTSAAGINVTGTMKPGYSEHFVYGLATSRPSLDFVMWPITEAKQPERFVWIVLNANSPVGATDVQDIVLLPYYDSSGTLNSVAIMRKEGNGNTVYTNVLASNDQVGFSITGSSGDYQVYLHMDVGAIGRFPIDYKYTVSAYWLA